MLIQYSLWHQVICCPAESHVLLITNQKRRGGDDVVFVVQSGETTPGWKDEEITWKQAVTRRGFFHRLAFDVVVRC